MSVYKRNEKYYCRFQIDGERHHYLCSGAVSKSEAEKIENGFKYKIQQRQNGLISQTIKEEKTFGFLCNEFLKYSKLNKKSYKADLSRINILKTMISSAKKINNIKASDIEKIKSKLLLRNCTKTTVNRYIEILSKMFNIAVDNEWLNKNPIKREMRFPIKNYVVRYLTKEEEDKLMEATPEHFKPIIITALQTGLRRRNLLDLKWEQIDFCFGIIRVPENKGNKNIIIKITNKLEKVLKKLYKDRKSDYVFINPNTGNKYVDFGREWNKIKEKAGIKNFRFHDLRHTVGTRLAEAGVPINTIKDLLAHSDIHTTMRYIHTVSADMEKAMDILNSYN